MKILLGICGSISAYKSYELLRTYIKNGHCVKVVLTKGSLHFVSPLIFKSLGAKEVYTHNEDFNLAKVSDGNVIHIDLVKWSNRIIIAPASANSIAKLASGICDDLLGSILLASNKETIIYPAMNTRMFENEITQRNFNALSRQKNIYIHPPIYGELACKDVGVGKLPDVETIYESSILMAFEKKKKKILINTGATISYIDPVRYVTNPASGKTGIAAAKHFLKMGYDVDLVCGHKININYLSSIPGLKIYYAQTTEQMYEICFKLFNSCDVYISSAAICDMKFETHKNKLKKDNFKDSLSFSQGIDILKELSLVKDRQLLIGFAAESSLDIQALKKKMFDKELDYLIANKVSNGIDNKQTGFDTNENNYILLSKEEILFEGKLNKVVLSEKLENIVSSHV